MQLAKNEPKKKRGNKVKEALEYHVRSELHYLHRDSVARSPLPKVQNDDGRKINQEIAARVR